MCRFTGFSGLSILCTANLKYSRVDTTSSELIITNNFLNRNLRAKHSGPEKELPHLSYKGRARPNYKFDLKTSQILKNPSNRSCYIFVPPIKFHHSSCVKCPCPLKLLLVIKIFLIIVLNKLQETPCQLISLYYLSFLSFQKIYP